MCKSELSYEDLQKRVQELEAEVARLKGSGAFDNSTGTTVTAPEPFKPIFDDAQNIVRDYFKNLKLQPTKGTIEINDQRYVLVRASSLSYEFFTQITQLYANKGKDEAFNIGRNFLFDIGHVLGMEDAKRFHDIMDLKDPVQKLSAGPVHFAYAGWAYVDILPESKPSPDDNYYLKYHHPYSFEADSWIRSGEKSEHPVCIMNAAYSSGWCEESFGIPLTAVEISCKAKGDDNCTFIMAPPHKIHEYLEEEVTDPIAKGKLEVPLFFERKQMEEQLRSNLKEKEVLLKEIHHRVKNNLQIISSMLNLQFGSSSDGHVLELLEASKNRVKTMALVHEKLYGSQEMDKVSIKEYLKSILELHISIFDESEIKYDDSNVGEDLKVNIDRAIIIGLIANEMFSNSYKYAFDQTDNPVISVAAKIENNKLELKIADNGRGIKDEVLFPNEETLGFELIQALIEQVSAEIELDRSNGTMFNMKFLLT